MEVYDEIFEFWVPGVSLTGRSLYSIYSIYNIYSICSIYFIYCIYFIYSIYSIYIATELKYQAMSQEALEQQTRQT